MSIGNRFARRYPPAWRCLRAAGVFRKPTGERRRICSRMPVSGTSAASAAIFIAFTPDFL